MKPHVSNYFKHFGLYPGDYIACEVCNEKAVDLHHIDIKGMGGQKKQNKSLNSIENIIALCRTCHEKAHAGNISKDYLRKLHLTKI